jgi:hypothetical protein
MKSTSYFTLVGLACGSVLLGGCTTQLPYVKAHSLTNSPVSEKIPVAIELRLDENYRNAHWEMKYMGNTTVLPIGPHLCTNTVAQAQDVSGKVAVTTNAASAAVLPGVSALLIPRLVYLDVSGDMRKDPITMALEWTLLDSSRRLVWVDSYRSDVRGPVEGVKGTKRKIQRRFDMALEDLFRQSVQGMVSSPEIRRFALSVGNSPQGQ